MIKRYLDWFESSPYPPDPRNWQGVLGLLNGVMINVAFGASLWVLLSMCKALFVEG